ncbi:hypothetical protein N9B82_02255 [Saprospiraceae bacterium]|nr:hypothetical protein [Saprospiraceae bacterium]
MKTIIAVAFSLILTFPAFAQDGKKRGERKEKIENLKIAFITKELNLTPTESEKFWPIYNSYQNELKAIRKDAKGDQKREDMDNMSDADADVMLTKYMTMQREKLDLEAETMKSLKPILGSKRILQLMKVEGKFKRQILQRAGGKSKIKGKGEQKRKHKGKYKRSQDNDGEEGDNENQDGGYRL